MRLWKKYPISPNCRLGERARYYIILRSQIHHGTAHILDPIVKG